MHRIEYKNGVRIPSYDLLIHLVTQYITVALSNEKDITRLTTLHGSSHLVLRTSTAPRHSTRE